MKDNILEINNLTKIYHNEEKEIVALKDVSFDVKDKEFISIVGPSGCGKSTILTILAGILNKSSGDIIFNRDNLKLGYMLQEDCLFSWKTVLENACLGLEMNKSLNKENKENVINLLNKYGLSDFKDSYPDSLSGGLKQRVALIRTLATNPDILLLDEPFSALDYQTRLTLSDDLYKIIKNEGKTAIMVTHDISEAISLSSRVIIISNRPGMVKKIIDIDLSNSLPTLKRKDIKFMDYYEIIWKELDHHV